MLRYLVILCCIAAGVAAAVLDFVWGLSTLAPPERGIPGHPSSEERRLLFEGCITFYGVVYTTGRVLNRALGAHADAAQLEAWSKGHMALLHIIGGAWLVVAGIVALMQAGMFRPSLIVGVLFVAMAVRDGRAALEFSGIGHTTFWRGGGLLAMLAGVLTLASCSGLMGWHPLAATLGGAVTALAGGLVCRHFGRKWKQGHVSPTLLWIPLEAWGWVYIVVGGLYGLLAIVGFIGHRG